MIFKIEKGGSETLQVGMNKSNLILPENAKHETFQDGYPIKDTVIHVISNDDMYAQIEFNKKDDISSIEIVKPSIASFKTFNNLFDTSFFDIYKFLRHDGDNILIDGAGIRSNKYQFGLYIPFLSDLGEDEDTFKIESIIMFEVGYYDKVLKSDPSALHDEKLAKLLDQAAGL